MNAINKYKIRTDISKRIGPFTVYRIEALREFGSIKKGELGGWIEKEANLSQCGTCWVYDDADVYNDAMVADEAMIGGNAKIYNQAQIYNNVEIFGDAHIYGYARIYNNVQIYDNVKVHGHTDMYGNYHIGGNADIKSITDYYVAKNTWSSGRFFVYTRSNKKWNVGCFYGTSKELIEKAYRDSKLSGQEYERVVKYVEEMYNNIESHT